MCIGYVGLEELDQVKWYQSNHIIFCIFCSYFNAECFSDIAMQGYVLHIFKSTHNISFIVAYKFCRIIVMLFC